MYRERRRDADAHGIGRRQPFDVGARFEPFGRDEPRHTIRRDVLDITEAIVELLDLCAVDVQADDLEPDLSEPEHEREADIPQTNDADGVVAPGNTLFQ